LPKVAPQNIRDCSEGIIQSVDPAIVAPNSVYLAVNFLFHKYLGRAKLRGGTTQLGTQIVNNKTILGLYQHITASGTKVPLAVINDSGDANSDVFAYTAGTWSICTGTGINLTKNKKAHLVTFLDTTALVNGSEQISTTDGEAWVNTGGNLDIGNMPAAKYIIEFKDRVYVAGVSGNLDTLYYSSIRDAGAISWTVGNGNIPIEEEEGAGAITGLAKVPGYLLVFKERSLKRWDVQSTYPESLIDIGCPSQEGIVMTRQLAYYFNKRGIFETNGGYPRKISRRIQDIIDAIPSSYYSSVSGWGDGENVYFSIGDITIDDLDITNCVIAYNIDTKTWSLLSFPNEFMVWYHYVDSNGDEIVVAGDDDGNVWKVFEGTQDGSSDISWLLQYHPQEFGSRGRLKDITNLVVYTKNVRNGILNCRTNEDGNFKPVGNITKDVQHITTGLRGHSFEFRLNGIGINSQIIGIDLPDLNINLSYDD